MSDLERLYAWRVANPELVVKQNRVKSAKRHRATVALRERHRDEYEALVAAEHEKPGYDPYSLRHYQEALRVLRAAHPEEWRALLSEAKA